MNGGPGGGGMVRCFAEGLLLFDVLVGIELLCARFVLAFLIHSSTSEEVTLCFARLSW